MIIIQLLFLPRLQRCRIQHHRMIIGRVFMMVLRIVGIVLAHLAIDPLTWCEVYLHTTISYNVEDLWKFHKANQWSLRLERSFYKNRNKIVFVFFFFFIFFKNIFVFCWYNSFAFHCFLLSLLFFPSLLINALLFFLFSVSATSHHTILSRILNHHNHLHSSLPPLYTVEE